MSWRFFRTGDVSTAKALSILKGPLISEKSTFGAKHDEVVFKVARDASKPEIRKSVEKIFKVQVRNVTTSNLKGKPKRFRGVWGKRASIKKAFVRLQKGQSIDLGAGNL